MLGKSRKGQIAFEFVIVYTLILVVFILFFALITSQRATSIQSEQEASLQLIAQNIATDINQALISGSGYSATIQLPQSVTGSPYNVYVSTTGVVIVNTTIGTQTFSTYAFSNARNLVINGKKLPTSANGIQIYELPTSPASYNITSNTINLFLAQQYSSQFYISNYHGTLFIDKQSPNNINYAKNAYANVESSDFAIFNGYDSLISVANSNALNPTNAVTLSAWVYPEKYSTDNRNGGGIISKSTQYEISINASGYAVIDGVLHSTPFYSNIKVPLNKWSFIAGTLNSNGTATICVNAACKSNSSTAGSLLITGEPLYIGFGSILGGGATTPSPGAATYFNGSIANAQVYNNQLSQYQISSLYQEGINGIPLTQNLSGWWPLDGNANDYSRNKDNGIAENVTFDNYAFTANNPAAYAPYFNVGDYAESSNAPKITSQITVCGWINYNTPNNAYIGGQYESFMIGNSRLALNGVKSNIYTNGIDIHISTNGKRNGEMEFSGGNTFTPGSWHFICGEYTGSNYLGFIDGVQVFNESGPQFNTNLGNIWIGGNSFGGGMSGSIEGVQIYNTSITPSQVLQLYYQGLPVSEK